MPCPESKPMLNPGKSVVCVLLMCATTVCMRTWHCRSSHGRQKTAAPTLLIHTPHPHTPSPWLPPPPAFFWGGPGGASVPPATAGVLKGTGPGAALEGAPESKRAPVGMAGSQAQLDIVGGFWLQVRKFKLGSKPQRCGAKGTRAFSMCMCLPPHLARRAAGQLTSGTRRARSPHPGRLGGCLRQAWRTQVGAAAASATARPQT